MKRKLVLIFALLFSAKLIAEVPEILVQADLDANFIYTIYDDKDYDPFCFYMVPYLTTTVKIPTDNISNMYLGTRLFPAVSVNHLEIYGMFGYAFARPDGWENYHFEVTGNLGLGAQIGFITGVSVLPIGEIGCQVFLMPDNRGIYCGIGPKALFMLFPYDDYISVSNSLGFELSVGYKF